MPLCPRFVVAALLAGALVCCKSTSTSNPEAAPSARASAEPGGPGVERFGAPLEGLAVQPLGALIATPEQFQAAPVRVNGLVRRACERKGCWMELVTGTEPNAKACRVRFKDYGFFVPTDSAGAEATLEGMVEVRKVSPGRVRHLENEGAVFASKNEDGSANEVQIVATGVELVRRGG